MLQAFRASLLHFLDTEKPEFFDDGILVVKGGKVVEVGPATAVKRKLPKGVKVKAFPKCLLVPGFVDTHTHFPQIDVVASPAADTLDWLERHTFPAEAAFKDAKLARAAAKRFLDELSRNGTTTALVFATVHPVSVEALFEAAKARNFRLIAGKVMMDRNAPADLRDTPESSERDTRKLIEKWHGRGRLGYAVTPRFAPTSSPAQLEAAGRLLKENPGVRLHTHLAETPSEMAWVKKLFPERKHYLDVYDHYGLVGDRSIFAHGIHLSDPELSRLSQARSAIAFCPTSNLFLGSGLFDYARVKKAGVKIAVATDIGGGTSFSLLRTLAAAQNICRLRGHALTAPEAFYLATLGGARALGLEGQIGNFQVGKEADFTVLDFGAVPLLAQRAAKAKSLDEKLFALMVLGDERCVRGTYLMGKES